MNAVHHASGESTINLLLFSRYVIGLNKHACAKNEMRFEVYVTNVKKYKKGKDYVGT